MRHSKYTNVDATNRTYFVKAIEDLKDAPGRSWKLVQAFDRITGLDRLRRRHTMEQKKLPQEERVIFNLLRITLQTMQDMQYRKTVRY